MFYRSPKKIERIGTIVEYQKESPLIALSST